MKKAFLLFLVLSTALLPLLVSCSYLLGNSAKEISNGGDTSGGGTVTFNSGGGSDVPFQNVKPGGTADRPANPVQAKHSFVNWYSDASLQTVYDFTQPVTEDITLYAEWRHELKSVIESGVIPADLSTYGFLVRTVLEPYAADAAIVAKYVDVTAQGNGDASSWEHAAGDIKTTMDAIIDAGPDTVYLVLIASGTHTPADILAMKNHAAIIGGWNKWEQAGTSTISGGNARQVFSNNGIDHTALLYGVTIADGNSGSNGGGMYNENASPALINVTFSGNKAIRGSGMYNNNSSSPTLSNVTFASNEASYGSGMYNNSSSPTLSNVTFASNEAAFGSGMYNNSSSPTLSNVTFVNNQATGGGGGGMINVSGSSPTLINVTFSGNTAFGSGGGMFNDNDALEGPTIVNTLFWNNGDSTSATVGQQIYIYNNQTFGRSNVENMSISFSLVQHGITATGSVTADDDATDGLGIGGGSATVTVTQANNISEDPQLAADLTDNGGFVQTIALSDNSPAADAGVYVQRSGTPGSFTFYYSEDDANWFSDAVLSSSGSAPPADALDLTAADARGYARNGRPDIGAYEYDGTAP